MCNLVTRSGPFILIRKKPSSCILRGEQADFAPFVGLLVKLSFLALKKMQKALSFHEIGKEFDSFFKSCLISSIF